MNLSLYYYSFRLCLVIWIQSVSCNNCIWPSLDKTLGGRLKAGTPLSLPCFSEYEGQLISQDLSTCAQIQGNYTSSDFPAQFYSGFTNNPDEMCASNATDQCLLDPNNPTDPIAFKNTSCNQGIVSPYYIEVQYISDITTALDFSRVRKRVQLGMCLGICLGIP